MSGTPRIAQKNLGVKLNVLSNGVPVSDLPSAIAITDIDADDRPDLLTVGGKEASVLRKFDGLRFLVHETYAVKTEGYPELGTGDIDGDGALDLVLSHLGAVDLLRNRGDGTFDPVSRYLDASVADLRHAVSRFR
jgi:hypothetical protein